MMTRWCRAAANYSRVMSQRNNLISSNLYASSCLNYSKVAAAAEPAVADHLGKDHGNRTEVSELQPKPSFRSFNGIWLPYFFF